MGADMARLYAGAVDRRALLSGALLLSGCASVREMSGTPLPLPPPPPPYDLEVWPFSSVGRVGVYRGATFAKAIGTAWVTSPFTLATAAHVRKDLEQVLFSPSGEALRVGIEFRPSKIVFVALADIRCDPGYATDPTKRDVACIALADALALQPITFGALDAHAPLVVAGYPGANPQQVAVAEASTPRVAAEALWFKANTEAGQSGGPVLMRDAQKWSAVAIYRQERSGWKQGVITNENVIRFLLGGGGAGGVA